VTDILRNALIARKKIITGNVRENILLSGVVRRRPAHFVGCLNQPMIYSLQDFHKVKQGIVEVALPSRFGKGSLNTSVNGKRSAGRFKNDVKGAVTDIHQTVFI
jgi:hypothetical protein